MTSEVNPEMQRHFERKLRMISTLKRKVNKGLYGCDPELLNAALRAIIDDSFEIWPFDTISPIDSSEYKDPGHW